MGELSPVYMIGDVGELGKGAVKWDQQIQAEIIYAARREQNADNASRCLELPVFFGSHLEEDSQGAPAASSHGTEVFLDDTIQDFRVKLSNACKAVAAHWERARGSTHALSMVQRYSEVSGDATNIIFAFANDDARHVRGSSLESDSYRDNLLGVMMIGRIGNRWSQRKPSQTMRCGLGLALRSEALHHFCGLYGPRRHCDAKVFDTDASCRSSVILIGESTA